MAPDRKPLPCHPRRNAPDSAPRTPDEPAPCQTEQPPERRRPCPDRPGHRPARTGAAAGRRSAARRSRPPDAGRRRGAHPHRLPALQARHQLHGRPARHRHAGAHPACLRPGTHRLQSRLGPARRTPAETRRPRRPLLGARPAPHTAAAGQRRARPPHHHPGHPAEHPRHPRRYPAAARRPGYRTAPVRTRNPGPRAALQARAAHGAAAAAGLAPGGRAARLHRTGIPRHRGRCPAGPCLSGDGPPGRGGHPAFSGHALAAWPEPGHAGQRHRARRAGAVCARGSATGRHAPAGSGPLCRHWPAPG